MSQSCAVWSLLPVARVCPSGLKATELTVSVWPAMTGPGRSQSRAVLSALPVARVCPLGLKATDQTMLVWPVGWGGAGR